MRILPPFSAVFGEALRLARSRFGTLLALALLPLLPLALLAPFATEVFFTAAGGVVDASEIALAISPWTTATAFLGLLLGFVVSLVSSAGMFAALGSPTDPGPRAALSVGARRWIAVAWTQLLTVLAVAATAVPLFAVAFVSERVLGPDLADLFTLRVVLLVVAVLLLIPVFVVATWYALAVIPAALGTVWGSGALAVSHRLVAGLWAPTFGFLFLWFLLELILSLLLALLFPSLTLFQALTYYLTTSILGSAYLFAIYRALRNA